MDDEPRAPHVPRWVISNETGLPTILRSPDAPRGQPDNQGRCEGCGRRSLCVCTPTPEEDALFRR